MKTTAGWTEPICGDAASEEINVPRGGKKRKMRQCGANCRNVTHTVALAKPVGATR